MTFDTSDPSDEQPWPDQQKYNDKDKYNDKYKDKDKDNDINTFENRQKKHKKIENVQ